MKKLAFTAVLAAAIIALYLGKWHHSNSASKMPVTEDRIADGADQSPARKANSHNEVRVPRLSRELLEHTTSEQAPEDSSLVLSRRDDTLEQLLLTQGRDATKEQQLMSQLADLYADRPEASFGEVACSFEFCRVDLRVSGKVDGATFWGKDEALRAAAEAKGLTIFLAGTEDDNNTTATCYFGRADSWNVTNLQRRGVL